MHVQFQFAFMRENKKENKATVNGNVWRYTHIRIV